MAPFPHLHVSSAYSMRYGTAFPQALAERAFEHGMDILALTDRDGLYGAIKHARACADAGISPVYGVNFALSDEDPARGPLSGEELARGSRSGGEPVRGSRAGGGGPVRGSRSGAASGSRRPRPGPGAGARGMDAGRPGPDPGLSP